MPSIVRLLFDEIKATIEAHELFDGVDERKIAVVFDQDQSVDAKVDRAISRGRGAVVVVTYIGKTNEERNTRYSKDATVSLACQVFNAPVLRRGMTPPEELTEAIEDLFDGMPSQHAQPGEPLGCDRRWHWQSTNLVPNDKALIYSVELQIRTLKKLTEN